MKVDTEYLALAVLIGGVLIMSMQDRKPDTRPPPESQAVPMEDVEEIELRQTKYIELDPVEQEKNIKKAFQDGRVNARCQMIVKYIIDESRKMINLQNYFDNALNSPTGIADTEWMKANYPDEYLNWQAARVYCLNRANEFKNLWQELGTLGEFQWMAANQFYVNVPIEVLNRLDSFNQGTTTYAMQMTMNQINQQLIQIYRKDNNIMEDPAPEDFSKMTEKQKNRLRNQTVMMEVDNNANEGAWLIPTSTDPSHVQFQRITQVGRQVGGIQMVQRTIQEAQGPRDEIAQVMYGVDPYANVTGTSTQGGAFSTLPPGTKTMDRDEADELFTVHKDQLFQDRSADFPGQVYTYQNPSANGRASKQFSAATGQYGAADDRDANRPQNTGVTGDDWFRVAKASNIKGKLPDNPFQQEQFSQMKNQGGALDNKLRDLREEAKDQTYTQGQLAMADGVGSVAHNNVPGINTVENKPNPPTRPDYINETHPTDEQPRVPEIVIPPSSRTVTAPAAPNPQEGQLWASNYDGMQENPILKRKRSDSLDIYAWQANTSQAQAMKVAKTGAQGKATSTGLIGYGQ